MIVSRALARLGGIATRAELLRAGCWPESLTMSINYGKSRRVRPGWYASNDTPAAVVRAVRVGGRLACLSALAYHRGDEDPDVLHILVPRGASGLRVRDEKVVVHWTRKPLDGTRHAVTEKFAEQQALACTR